MSTRNRLVYLTKDILDFYTRQLNAYGDSSKGVGWKNDEAQLVRFAQLAKVIEARSGFTINDLGCGTGKFYDFLLAEGFSPALYHGYDILDEMIQTSKQKLPPDDKIRLTKISSASGMKKGHYTIASGIFNVKYEAREYEWLCYILETVEQMNKKSINGFAFNLLTKYSDSEFKQSYLFYADPLYFFDYCKRNFAKDVALLHDYGQYDFTIIVRK